MELSKTIRAVEGEQKTADQAKTEAEQKAADQGSKAKAQQAKTESKEKEQQAKTEAEKEAPSHLKGTAKGDKGGILGSLPVELAAAPRAGGAHLDVSSGQQVAVVAAACLFVVGFAVINI